MGHAESVIASVAKQSPFECWGLLRRCAPRNDMILSPVKRSSRPLPIPVRVPNPLQILRRQGRNPRYLTRILAHDTISLPTVR